MSKLFNRNKGSNKTNEIPDIVVKIKHMYSEAYSAKSNLTSKWKECYNAYTGDTYKKQTTKDRANAIPNHIFATVETVKPIMVTNRPKNIVLPKSQNQFDKAMKLQQALDYEWSRTRFFNKILEFITYGLIYGTSIIGLFWNGKASKGIGEVEPVVISPFNFFIDPLSTSIKEADYCMYATYKSLGELITAYPSKADELKENATNDVDDNLTFGQETQNVKNQLLFIECYLRDYEILKEKDENGEETHKLKYPNGRRVIIAGDVLLYDGENPYKDGNFPFREWRCYDMPNQFWGMGEVEPLMSIQKEICELYDDIIENAHLMGNPVWILDKNSGVAQGSLTNRKGLVVRKNPGTEVKREAPAGLPAYIQNIVNDLKYDVQVVSGVYDATRGERPTSITSGVAIQALQESSQGRIRLKTQDLETVLSDLGGMWVHRIQQFWKLPRTIRIMGGEYNQDVSEDTLVQGQPVKFEDVIGDEVDGDFDVEILTGSTMATNRSARLDQLMQMSQLMAEDGKPMIDRRTLLQNAEIDNVDEVIKRFEQQAQMEQEMAMQQQAQQMALQSQQADLAHQQELDRMRLNNEAQMMAKQMDIQGKIALQSQNKDVQSEVGELDENMSVEDLINYISMLSDEELQAYLKKNPKVITILNSLNNL